MNFYIYNTAPELKFGVFQKSSGLEEHSISVGCRNVKWYYHIKRNG